jgi:predicted TIM-barrel enzyme
MPGFRARFSAAKRLIGMMHLPALPGYPGSPGPAAILAHAIAELATHRIDGLEALPTGFASAAENRAL